MMLQQQAAGCTHEERSFIELYSQPKVLDLQENNRSARR
jgi:hypothetical protein